MRSISAAGTRASIYKSPVRPGRRPARRSSSCLPADPNISGLAWNPSFDLLWMATNSEFDDIFLLDPTTCEILTAVFHPEPGGNGAGLELDAGGNLWTVSQNGGDGVPAGVGSARVQRRAVADR